VGFESLVTGLAAINPALWASDPLVRETKSYLDEADCLATDITSLENTDSWSHDRS
jgi:hypothetical protein